MPTYTAATELDLVNLCLDMIDEAPINSLATSEDDPDISAARNLIAETSREILATSWWFNTEIDYPLTPTSGNEIIIPPTISKVLVPNERYAIKEGKLWNRKERTFTFTQAIEAEVTFYTPFDEMPEEARRLIATRTARRFADRKGPEQLTFRATREDEQMAYEMFMAEETRMQDASLQHPVGPRDRISNPFARVR